MVIHLIRYCLSPRNVLDPALGVGLRLVLEIIAHLLIVWLGTDYYNGIYNVQLL